MMGTIQIRGKCACQFFNQHFYGEKIGYSMMYSLSGQNELVLHYSMNIIHFEIKIMNYLKLMRYLSGKKNNKIN